MRSSLFFFFSFFFFALLLKLQPAVHRKRLLSSTADSFLQKQRKTLIIFETVSVRLVCLQKLRCLLCELPLPFFVFFLFQPKLDTLVRSSVLSVQKESRHTRGNPGWGFACCSQDQLFNLSTVKKKKKIKKWINLKFYSCPINCTEMILDLTVTANEWQNFVNIFTRLSKKSLLCPHLHRLFPWGEALAIHQDAQQRFGVQFLLRSCQYNQLSPENRLQRRPRSCSPSTQCTLSSMLCAFAELLQWR